MTTKTSHRRPEGSLTKRKDGRWEARLTLPDGLGRRSWYARTRQDAAKKLAEAQRDVALGVLQEASARERVDTLLEGWLATTRSTVRPHTYTRYDQLLHQHALPTLGRLSVSALGPQHLQQLYAAKLGEGLAPNTVRLLHRVLHRALGQAQRQGVVGRNVAAAVTPPRAARKGYITLTDAQARALLAEVEASHDPLYALYVLALATGMRQGELMGLRGRDIDLERGWVQVMGSLQRIDGVQVLVEPKTEHSRRRLFLPPHGVAIATLRRHALSRIPNPHDLLFTTPDGAPLVGTLLTKHFQRHLRHAGLPRMRFHDLRHTAATLLLEHGVHPKIVSEMLGHTTIGMTMDTYSHVSPSMQAQAASVLNDVLTGKEEQ